MCHLKNVIKLVLNRNLQELYSSRSVYKTTMLLKWYHLTLISYRINFLDGRINRFNMIKLVRISFSAHALQFVKQTFSKIINLKVFLNWFSLADRCSSRHRWYCISETSFDPIRIGCASLLHCLRKPKSGRISSGFHFTALWNIPTRWSSTFVYFRLVLYAVLNVNMLKIIE